MTKHWLVWLALALPLAAQEPRSLTLEQAVAAGLEGNPSVQAARA
jgi:hypothetical protein